MNLWRAVREALKWGLGIGLFFGLGLVTLMTYKIGPIRAEEAIGELIKVFLFVSSVVGIGTFVLALLVYTIAAALFSLRKKVPRRGQI